MKDTGMGKTIPVLTFTGLIGKIIKYELVMLPYLNGYNKPLLRVRWSNPLLEAIYEINLKIAPLQLNKSQYLSRIEGSPPKRNVAGSIPVWDASKQR